MSWDDVFKGLDEPPDVPLKDGVWYEYYYFWEFQRYIASTGREVTEFELYRLALDSMSLFSEEYDISINTALMYLSKGGITLSDCNSMTGEQKDNYLTSLETLWKTVNEANKPAAT